MSGAVAGGVSRTAVAPLETLKTYVMVGGGAYAGKGIGQIFTTILRNEGWTGLFRGNGAREAAPFTFVPSRHLKCQLKRFCLSPRPLVSLLVLEPVGINVIRIAPAKAIELTVFESAKKALARPASALSENG